MNEEKSDLNPSQSVEYLGMSIDTVVTQAFPTIACVERFLSIARRFLLRQNPPPPPPPAQLWQVLLGHMSSLEKLVPHGRLRMRSIQWHLKSHWSPERDPPHLPVPRSRQVEEDLSWWMVRDHLLKGMNFGTPTPDLHFYSDASRSGWGAHLLDQSVSGIWLEQESSLHINLLEMKALFLAIKSFVNIVTNHRVTAMCDNSTVVAYVNKQGGTVSDSLCSLTGQLLRWTVPQCPSGSEVPARAIQCPGRSPQPSESSAGCRMVLPSAGGKETDPNLGVPVAGLVRDTSQREAVPVLLPNPGPPGRLRGCLPSPLKRPRRVRISSFPPGRESRGPSQRDPKSLDDPGRPSLTRESVVCRPPSPPDPTTSGTSPVGPTATPAALQLVPRKRPRPEPSRVATLKRLLRKSGFSRRAVLKMSGCVRKSTARFYQSQWLSFCGWCRGRGVTPIDATIPLIVDFLIHLRVDKGFSLSALKGYRSTISSVMALKGVDLAASLELSMLFRSFAKSCSPDDLCPPAWDVALVLQSLTEPPYEPLKTVEERFLTQKTLFLIALGSAKQVGELHALSYRVSHSVGWKEVSFSFVPGFVAKTQDQSSLDPRFESFMVPALPKSNGSPNGRLLCPVRAVKYYLTRTAQHRLQCERLFVTSGRTKKETFKNTVSSWLWKVISRAYQLSGKALPAPSPLARETRGIAPSLLFKKNYAVNQVLKAGTWRRHTTFTLHYLRDLSHKSLDTFHLGPMVAAQAMV